MTEAERLFDKHASKIMNQYNKKTFKASHPRLRRAILAAINEAFEI